MEFGSQTYASRRDTIAFVVCLALSVIARADPLGVSPQIAAGLRASVLVPFISLQHQTQLIRDRREEFAQLVRTRDSVVMVTQDVANLRSENVRLRTLLGLSQRLHIDHVAAEVLHQVEQGDMNTLLVTAGSNLGVRPFAPVIAPEGLVGYVFEVGPTSSVVHTWTYPDFRASASTVNGSVVGLVAPRAGIGPSSVLEIREVAHLATLEPGTPIVTTGLGGVYPRGVLIGTSSAMTDEQAGLSKTYQVEPAVHPAAVSHVLILLADSTPPINLAPLFIDPAR